MEGAPMERTKKVVAEREVGHRAGKRPYTPPTLTVHGDVEDVTEVLRLAGAKSEDLSGDIPEKSDRAAKENFSPVDCFGVLARLAAINVETWNYKGESLSVRHMGPMAQDFARAFGLGSDDKSIHTVDASGVALASIQALHRMLLEREAEIGALREQVEELKREVAGSREGLVPLGG
jgi:hypothetical protein